MLGDVEAEYSVSRFRASPSAFGVETIDSSITIGTKNSIDGSRCRPGVRGTHSGQPPKLFMTYDSATIRNLLSCIDGPQLPSIVTRSARVGVGNSDNMNKLKRGLVEPLEGLPVIAKTLAWVVVPKVWVVFHAGPCH